MITTSASKERPCEDGAVRPSSPSRLLPTVPPTRTDSRVRPSTRSSRAIVQFALIFVPTTDLVPFVLISNAVKKPPLRSKKSLAMEL